MVRIDRIYTRAGDDGQTSLGDGARIAKTATRIRAIGVIDELNSVLGLIDREKLPDEAGRWLQRVQNDLFDIGADVSVPAKDTQRTALRLNPDRIGLLETWIDNVTANLQPLRSFVLPGGIETAAQFHHARTVCRRAELELCCLAEAELVSSPVLQYMNRLSDLLFVLARSCNDNGRNDILWTPGGSELDQS